MRINSSDGGQRLAVDVEGADEFGVRVVCRLSALGIEARFADIMVDRERIEDFADRVEVPGREPAILSSRTPGELVVAVTPRAPDQFLVKVTLSRRREVAGIGAVDMVTVALQADSAGLIEAAASARGMLTS